MHATGFILIHGAWHDHHCWEAVVRLLEAAGHPVRALDLPGAGVNARRPLSADTDPPDAEGMVHEPSPNADVTQQARTDAVIAVVRDLVAASGRPPVVVGHSLGGLTVSPVAQTVPDEIAAAVYLTAMMLPPGMKGAEVGVHPASAGSQIASLLLGDAGTIGARRLNPRSTDPDYIARVRQAFYGDLTDAQFDSARTFLHPDEPLSVAVQPSPITKDRFGRVPRHYIECLQDHAITIAMQREMVRMVDAAMGGATRVHTMDCSHSPFYSQPQALADILIGIAAESDTAGAR